MTLQIKLTDTGDIDLSTGVMQWISGQDAILQHIQSRLSFALGNFSIYPQAGTAYFEYILGQKDKYIASEVIKNRIKETPGVKSILEFSHDFEPTTRILNISFKCTTIYGIINANGLNFNI